MHTGAPGTRHLPDVPSIGDDESVRHARASALDQLEPLLAELRRIEVLREKTRGTFYRGSKAFLHFHEDPDGLFADVRFGTDFERMRVTTPDEQAQLLRRVRAVTGPDR